MGKGGKQGKGGNGSSTPGLKSDEQFARELARNDEYLSTRSKKRDVLSEEMNKKRFKAKVEEIVNRGIDQRSGKCRPTKESRQTDKTWPAKERNNRKVEIKEGAVNCQAVATATEKTNVCCQNR